MKPFSNTMLHQAVLYIRVGNRQPAKWFNSILLPFLLVLLFCNLDMQAQENSLPAKFNAVAMDNKFVLTHWSMPPSELHEVYIVERSLDGKKFETIVEITGEGGRAETINYSYMDEEPYNGASYYRLRKKDSEENITSTSAVPVLVNKLQFTVYPNPASASENLTVEFRNIQNQEVVVQMFDMAGKRVLKKNLQMNEDLSGVSINLADVQTGLYTLTFSGNTFFEKQNLTVYQPGSTP